MKRSPRARRLLDYFLLTEEKWQKIYDFQRGLCGVCKRPMKKPNVDHNHVSGRVNGLLCPMCNRALGRVRDSLAWLQSAVEYLTHPPATAALGYEHIGRPGRIGTKKMRRLIRKEKLDKAAKS